MGYYAIYDADGFFGRTDDRMEAVKMAWARWRHWYLPPAEGDSDGVDTMMSDLTTVFYVEEDGRTEIYWNADLKELFWG